MKIKNKQKATNNLNYTKKMSKLRFYIYVNTIVTIVTIVNFSVTVINAIVSTVVNYC